MQEVSRESSRMSCLGREGKRREGSRMDRGRGRSATQLQGKSEFTLGEVGMTPRSSPESGKGAGLLLIRPPREGAIPDESALFGRPRHSS